MMRRREVLGIAVVAGAVVLAVRCGGSNAKMPTTPTTSPPAPAPAPTPTPESIPGSYCKLGLGAVNNKCSVGTPTFQQAIDDAIAKAMRDYPSLFYVGDGIRTKSNSQMYVAVVSNLEAAGFCAYVNPGNEIQLKNSNDFDDSFNIVTSYGIMRIPARYTVTCTPASFPLDNTPLPPTSPDCPIGPSRSISCERYQPTYLDDVNTALNQVAQTRPDLVDTSTTAPGTQDGFAVKDAAAFTVAALGVLKTMGYCTHIDIGQVQIKKTNVFSDTFAIVTSTGFIRRGASSYRESCYPAEF